MSPKVSVIIPIYDVENYLEKCIDSVLNQTLEDIEIFLASDGPQACHDICDKYQAIDKRVKVVKDLKGYGKSVNQCINLAQGEYIGIVESDDWISPVMYEQLYSAAKQNDSDIAKASFIFAYDDVKRNNIASVTDVDTVVTLKQNPDLILFRQTIWSAIYKRDFLIKNSIYLYDQKRLSFIDAPFQAKAFLKANSISLISQPLYYYYQDNPNQSMQNLIKFAIDGVKVKEVMLDENPPITIENSNIRDAYIFHICRDLFNDYNLYHRIEDKKLFWSNARTLIATANGKELKKLPKNRDSRISLFIEYLFSTDNFQEYEKRRDRKSKQYRFLGIFKFFSEEYQGNNLFSFYGFPLMRIIKSGNKVYYKLFGVLPLVKVKYY